MQGITKALFLFIMITCIKENAQKEEEKVEKLEEEGRIVIKQGTAFVLEGRPYVSQQEVIFHQAIDFQPLYEALKETQDLALQLEQTCSKYETIFDLKEESPQKTTGKMRKIKRKRSIKEGKDNPIQKDEDLEKERNILKRIGKTRSTT